MYRNVFCFLKVVNSILLFNETYAFIWLQKTGNMQLWQHVQISHFFSSNDMKPKWYEIIKAIKKSYGNTKQFIKYFFGSNYAYLTSKETKSLIAMYKN